MEKKPTSPEDDYFAREEIEKLYRLAKETAANRKVEEAEALRKAHFMKCPKCGNDLSTVHFRDVEIDRCFHCNGNWLDAGELEKLAGAEEKHGILSAIFKSFQKSDD